MPLLIALIVVPLIEIGLFVQVGGAIGLWPTLLLVLLTAIAGATLLRAQGASTLGRLQAELQRGGDPSGPLAHGAMLLFAGALLLTPGFFTDAVGLALMSPQVRSWLIVKAGKRLATVIVARAGGARPGAAQARPDMEAPIDAEYRDVTDRER